MKPQATTYVGLTLLVTIFNVHAYPSGAPASACVTMIPGHGTPIEDSSTYPFYVDIPSSRYCPNEAMNIHVTSTSNNTFKGFLCQARTYIEGITNETVGRLVTTAPLYINNCPTTASITHTSSTPKANVTLIWTPDSEATDTVQIVCSLVIDYSTYITSVSSPMIDLGQDECMPAIVCEPGYFTQQETCVECFSGFYCPGSLGMITCPVGHLCPSGSASPLPCPCGTYCAGTGLTSPSGNCSEGYFCIEGAMSATPTDGVTGDICSPGNYCPTGSCRQGPSMESTPDQIPTSIPTATSPFEQTTIFDQTSASTRTTNTTLVATTIADQTSASTRTTNLSLVATTVADQTSTQVITSSSEQTTPELVTNPCYCIPPDPPQNGDIEIIDGEGVQAIFTCDVGYEFEFPAISIIDSYEIHCFCREWIGFTNVTCAPVDCGGHPTLNNGYIFYGDGTTFGAAAIFICNTGYTLYGLSSAVCMASGQWSRTSPSCVLVDCDTPGAPVNGIIVNTNSTIDTTFDSVINYVCDDGYQLEGHESRRCLRTGVWSGHIPLCIEVSEVRPEPCETHVDHRDTVWNTTPPGTVATKPCLNGYQGVISRNCTVRGHWLLPNYNCVQVALDEITKLVEGAVENPTEALVSTILANLSQVTTTESEDALYDGEIHVAAAALESIVDISQNITIDESQKQNFIRTASNLVDKKNVDSWKAINQVTEIQNDKNSGPAGVLRAVEGYGDVIANSTTRFTEIKERNIVFRVVNSSGDGKDSIRFPALVLAAELQTSSFYFLSNISLQDVKQYSTVFYKNLTEILPTSTVKNSLRNNNPLEINGAVLSLKLIPYKNNLESPLELTFQHFNTFYKNPVCSYWNFDSNGWDNYGCAVTSTNSTTTKCKCNHLTNFAILMSPYKQDVSKALNIVSMVGCGISLFGLVLTIVVHVALWRYVKAERVVLVLCLSVALIIFYIIFLVGVQRTENEEACTAIAVLLHYSLLVVFFMMLATAVEIAISVLYVFGTKFGKLKLLLPIAIGVPAIIVTISASVTKLNGYGTDDYCWLSTENGVIWAFIGPAIFVICVNIVVLVLILKTMHSTKLMSQKSNADRIRSTVKCICVLLPVMGITWILGLFYINDDTNWIQYLFAICNSLQGLVIFVFHCALSKQIHRGFVMTKRRYSVETSESRLAKERNRIRMKETL